MPPHKVGKIYHILYRDLNGKVQTVTIKESNKAEECPEYMGEV